MEDVEMASNNDQQETIPDNKKPLKFHKSTVSCLQECECSDAQNLCIFDISYKLDNKDEYDIGGTYTNKKPELWFYMTTDICPGENILLNLFVCHRIVGYFSIGISNSNTITTDQQHEDCIFLPEDLTFKTFKTPKVDQCHYIKTFLFKKSDLESFNEKKLIIPIRVEVSSKMKLNLGLVERVQAKHNIGSLIMKETTDFTVVSSSLKNYPTHKIVLCTHSPLLRDLIKNSTANSMSFDKSDEVIELLLEYAYTGAIKDISKHDSNVLLELAEKFQLNKLLPLIESAMKQKICIDNVLDIAKLSQKYQLHDVEKCVFKFFRENPEVLQTDAWKNLDDIALTKKLFEHVYFHK